MEIEAGKAYKHPEIAMPYIAVTKKEIRGREYWMLVSLAAHIELAMHGKRPDFTDEWAVSDEYATRSGMVEVDLRNYEIDDNGEAHEVRRVA